MPTYLYKGNSSPGSRPAEPVHSCGVSIQNKVLPKVEAVILRRKVDGQILRISSPCILRIASGLVQVVGGPLEELDTNIWDTTAKFEVIEVPSASTQYQPREGIFS